MKYILLIVVGLIILSYFRKKKKVKKKVQAVKTHRSKPAGPAFCPYCKFKFEERPKRNKKCPKCQSKIIVREGKLLTEEQASAFDERELAKHRKSIEVQNMRTLKDYEKSGVIKYVEICGGQQNSCQACKRLNGKRLRLKNELQKPTLPVKNCTSVYGYCRCCYTPVVD